MAFVSAGPGAIRLAVRVQPRSSRNRVAGLQGERLKIQVNAPPVDGAANRAVVEVVAEWAGVARRSVRIVSGESSREKVLEIETDDPEALARRMAAIVAT